MLFAVDKKLVFTSRNEGLAENMIQLKKKQFPLAAVDYCLRKWQKTISTSQKIRFH